MVRRRALPSGWYPTSREEAVEYCTRNAVDRRLSRNAACAAVVPHAGWAFSGELAVRTLARISPDTETVVVIGGHLRPGDPLHVAPEDAFETPLGPVSADAALRDRLTPDEFAVDTRVDNTVEVQLPMLACLVPDARIVWLRCAPDRSAVDLGQRIAAAARELNRVVAVVGSTDLTHYGPAYRYEPAGEGAEGRVWAAENDHRIVDAMQALRVDEVLSRANDLRAACSAGGAVAAMTYAAQCGCRAATLHGIESSYARAGGDSFVGYAGISYAQRDAS